MEFTKILKRWGNSIVIVFNPEDLEIMKKKTGDVVELEVKA